MNACEQIRTQLLGYLYDLLDDSDKQAVDAHLAGCEECHKRSPRREGNSACWPRPPRRLFQRALRAAQVEPGRIHRSPANETVHPIAPSRAGSKFSGCSGMGLPAAWFAEIQRPANKSSGKNRSGQTPARKPPCCK